MLLRSSSTPILNSWIIPQHYTNPNSSPNNLNEHKPSLTRTNSLSTRTTSSPSSSPSPTTDHTRPSMSMSTLLNSDLQDPPWPTTTRLQRLFSSSGLDEVVVPSAAEDGGSCSVGRGGMDGGGCGGGGGGGGYDYNSNNDNINKIDKYYQTMIKANPGDSLLLGNYARFLKEVRGDLGKAEEYCGRAILVNTSDANLLTMYADIIWQHRRDAQRAETYFDQAIKASPDNCYVHASYAKFLWDVEDEGIEVTNDDLGNASPSPPHYIAKTVPCSPLPTRVS